MTIIELLAMLAKGEIDADMKARKPQPVIEMVETRPNHFEKKPIRS